MTHFSRNLQKVLFITGMALLAAALAGCQAQPPVASAPTEAVDAAQSLAAEPPAPTPTAEPTALPTAEPTAEPALEPTAEIKTAPTSEPTAVPKPAFAMVHFDVPPAVFSPKTASSTQPDDVLSEVMLSMGQGGGNEWDCTLMPKTSEKFSIYGDASGTWEDQFTLMACGWNRGEVISLTITGPDGSSVVEPGAGEPDLRYLQGGGALYYGVIEINTPPGTYRYLFSGESGSVSLDMEVKLPDAPRVYQGKDRTLILYGFQPGERVRLFAYETITTDSFNPMARLEVWQAYKVSSDGELVVQIDPSFELNHVGVVGDISGEVRFYPTILISLAEISKTKGLQIMLPTVTEAQSLDNIWESLHFEDLMKPGTRTYTLTVKPSDTFRWGFTWCADDPKKRDFPIAAFSVDGEKLGPAQLAVFDIKASNGWSCTQRVTILKGFESGASYRLKIYYKLDKDFYDGAATYPAGEYAQIIEVKVE